MNWLPKKGLGDFLLGDNIAKYIESYQLSLSMNFNITPDILSLSYKLNSPETYLYVDDGVITGISADETFIYQGVEFVGNHFSQISKILGSNYALNNPIEYEDKTVHIAIDFDELGLQIWVDEDFFVVYVSIYWLAN